MPEETSAVGGRDPEPCVQGSTGIVRSLIDLSTSMRQLNRLVRLSREARADIEWWVQFGLVWNGMAMMWHVDRSRPDLVLTSDASGA